MYLFFMERDNKQGASKCQSNIGTYPSKYQSTKYSENSAFRLWLTKLPHILGVICVRWVAPVHLSRPV